MIKMNTYIEIYQLLKKQTNLKQGCQTDLTGFNTAELSNEEIAVLITQFPGTGPLLRSGLLEPQRKLIFGVNSELSRCM